MMQVSEHKESIVENTTITSSQLQKCSRRDLLIEECGRLTLSFMNHDCDDLALEIMRLRYKFEKGTVFSAFFLACRFCV